MVILLIFIGLITVLPILGIGISLVISRGEKGDWAVAGWNTMSDEKKSPIKRRK